MKSSFAQLSTDQQNWLDAYLDGTISPANFEAMQDQLAKDPEYRAIAQRYLALDDTLANPRTLDDLLSNPWPKTPLAAEQKTLPFPLSRFIPLAAAAGLAFLLGSGLMFWWNQSSDTSPSLVEIEKIPAPSAQGFAVVGNLFDPTWAEGTTAHETGDSLGAENFRLASGTAEIQFFSGAKMTVEGPADISLRSAWEAHCHEGAVRMNVPPAARGFKLHSPSSEIIDLGTEFGLIVKDGQGKVEVFDGEIAIKHQGEEQKLIKKGRALELSAHKPLIELEPGKISFPNTRKFQPQIAEQLLTGFQSWQTHRDTLANDKDIIAYYTFDQETPGALIPNIALPRNPELDGAVILAEPVSGRWPGLKSAFEFRRPGSRVRVNIPGEFPALTFSCWVRIDSLDRTYNALFMGDGYENGEPHWQIKDDGRLMLSVMVDEDARHPVYPDQSRYHHIYYSPKIWDLSMSGQWLHLTSVFDPAAAQVSHYLNGKEVATEAIDPLFQVKTLRIGNGEIGNWGQPLRKDPSFTIRNLNGRMDELAIFKSALSAEKIHSIYEKSRSTHR